MSKEAERRCVENEDGLQIGAPSSPPSPYLHLVGECDSEESSRPLYSKGSRTSPQVGFGSLACFCCQVNGRMVATGVLKRNPSSNNAYALRRPLILGTTAEAHMASFINALDFFLL